MEYIRAARGADRLTALEALPCFDPTVQVQYFGSISKTGDNTDWDWGTYRDEKGEWVLAEADGPGCIFNFTQHRYPTSPVPTFRFYFDRSPTPQFEITPAEFGKKPPFLFPLADVFVGPEDGGRGPIWVVRSFVPMEFRTHCKVTSTVKLEGCDKARGEGGWGHLILHRYETAEGLRTFDPTADPGGLTRLYSRPLGLPGELLRRSATLAPGESLCLLDRRRRSTLTRLAAQVADFRPELLQDLVLRLTFDGRERVCAPFGTLFGCTWGHTPARLETALLTWDIRSDPARFENRFPMPFFESARVVLENRGNGPVDLPLVEIGWEDGLIYDPERTGYFSASPYYPPTPNVPGRNSVIAEVAGAGQMAYGVIAGTGIACGCEGDVRIFTDSLASPALQSDGSESWGSYGWGFVCPPQCNPFSAYNGLPDVNSHWSELRLTHTDCVPFRSRLRFELEHGCRNDGGGLHAGQIFYYGRPAPLERLLAEFLPGEAGYRTDGALSLMTDRFENGIHHRYATFPLNRGMTFSRFTVSLPEGVRGLVLKRVCSQEWGPMSARVLIDGVPVEERAWLWPDQNGYYRFLEDSFIVPSGYVTDKKRAEIELRPRDAAWNECRIRVFGLFDRPCEKE